jgi:phospho-N-acetylmuramoyl-pentapeptide-transferase
MLYYLFQFLDTQFDIPGAGVFQYISFRASMSIIASLIISMLIGRRIIRFLQYKQVDEIIRDLDLQGQEKKKGTPTMGGIIILASIIIPTLLFAKLDNVYVILMLISTVWLGLIGFADDYIKVFKKDKEGLAGRFKVLGQVGIGIIVGATLYFSDSVLVKNRISTGGEPVEVVIDGKTVSVTAAPTYSEADHSMVTTIPFLKNNEFDYSTLLFFMGDKARIGAGWCSFPSSSSSLLLLAMGQISPMGSMVWLRAHRPSLELRLRHWRGFRATSFSLIIWT